MHNNRQCVFDEITRWQIRYQPVKTATTWLLSRESGQEGQKRGISPGRNGRGTVSKIPALEHDVDSRDGVIMLSQAGKTVVPSKNSDVFQ